MIATKPKARSRAIAEKVIFAAFNIIKDAGGQMRGKQVTDKVRETVTFDEYESYVYEKTGYIRWESLLHFFTIDCMKAGYLLKENGVWILTDAGLKAIKLGPEQLLKTASQKYREWSSARPTDELEAEEEEDVTESVENKEQKQQALLQEYQQNADEGIRQFIVSKDAYDFQKMVSQLLAAMGYYIAHVSEKGPDGGIDIIAYTDPMGTKAPRLIVQVKHRPNDNVPSEDIQKLAGTMKRDSDVGIFVTSGQFSMPAKKEARNSHKHIELIDMGRFIALWTEHYGKMNDKQKNMLPLQPIYFLGSNE